MTARNYTNVAQAQTLTSDVSDSGTVLAVGTTASFPTAPFTVVVERRTANQEVCLCTAKTSTTLTVTRGFDGSPAIGHLSGSTVEHGVAALDYAEANAHVNTPHVLPTVINAKGDIIAGTADDTLDRLAVGADGYSLVPEATETTGLRYEKSRGTIVCTSGTRPTLGLYEGVRIYETDTKLFYVRLAATWMPEPGQLLGSTKVTSSSGFSTGTTIRITLNFTMPTLTGGRRVRINGFCYFVNLAVATTGQLYTYVIVTNSAGGGLGSSAATGYVASATAIGVPSPVATIDNTDIPAGATTVYLRTLVINAAGTPLSHQMAAATDGPAFLEAMIV